MEVLKVHQFESRFQSMSVIARDKTTKEVFVFSKGSPEKLHGASIEKFADFAERMRRLSL